MIILSENNNYENNPRQDSLWENSPCEDVPCEDTPCEDTACEDTACEDVTCGNTDCKKAKVSFAEKFGITGKKILTSLLAGFTLPFVLLICSTFSVFFSNSAEFTFVLSDFAPTFILIALGVFVVLTVALLLTKGLARQIIFTLCAFLVTAGYIQSTITTLTFKGMPGDGNVAATPAATLIINFAMWVILFGVFIWFGVLSNHAAKARNVMSFLLVLVLVMQTVGVLPAAIEYANKEPDTNIGTTEEDAEVYLTTNNMFQVSTKDNIIVIILDRMDNDYLREFLNSGSPYIDNLDGFTYYSDNIATYPRTYPAITSMLSGINTDFTLNREDYFEYAYTNSSFLKDLKANDYNVNLYISPFYSYTDANDFSDIVTNTSLASGYTITSQADLTSKMFELSSYFWAPEIFKSKTLSSGSFNEVIKLNGDAPEYDMTGTSDIEVFESFKETGISSQNEKNNFTFLHLRGSHSPTSMDKDGKLIPYGSVSVLEQTTGCFNLISQYIDQMKKLGIYEDATIIITGDHASITSDEALYEKPMLTGLLVKESGKYGEPLKTNNAQVSQENFLATIVKSAGLETTTDYGRAYFEVPENETVTRTHYFQAFSGTHREDENVTYKITGKGSDFSNWEITDREIIGFMYQ